jgi:hypothetical protein
LKILERAALFDASEPGAVIPNPAKKTVEMRNVDGLILKVINMLRIASIGIVVTECSEVVAD